MSNSILKVYLGLTVFNFILIISLFVLVFNFGLTLGEGWFDGVLIVLSMLLFLLISFFVFLSQVKKNNPSSSVIDQMLVFNLFFDLCMIYCFANGNVHF